MDGQTDGQTACNLITALCVGSRGKNTDLGISIDKVIATVGLKQLSTLAIATIVAEFGDYSRQCGQGFKRFSLFGIACFTSLVVFRR